VTRFPLAGRDRPPAPLLAPVAARVKPGARRLEYDVPLIGPCGGDGAGGGATVTLAGRLAPAGGRALLAARRGGKIYCVPAGSVACLTPSLASLAGGAVSAAAGAAAGARSSPPAAPPAPPLTPLTVRVARRETERQQEAREASFAHLADAEAREPWLALSVAPPAAPRSVAAWAGLAASGDAGGAAAGGQLDLSPRDYLDALAPAPPPSEYALPPVGAVAGGGDGRAPLGAAPAALAPPPRGSAAALLSPAAVASALASAWRASPVVSLDALRAALRRPLPPGGDAVAAAAAAAAPDAALRAAADAAGAVCVRGAYVASTPGGQGARDGGYEVLVSLLQSRPSFRRADLAAALAAAGVQAPDAHVARMVKALCKARGNLWCLRE